MSLDNVNGAEMKSFIRKAKQSNDVGSRSGRIDALQQISDLGKELLDALNVQDESMYEIMGEYDSVTNEMEKLQQEYDAQTEKAENYATSLEDIDDRIAELEGKIDGGEELTEDETRELEWLYKQRGTVADDVDDTNGNIKTLGGDLQSANTKLDGFNQTLVDIEDKMDGYTEAGAELKGAARDIGRSGMVNNFESAGTGNDALKRNESSWGWADDKGGANKTQKGLKRAGYTGMNDGAGGKSFTYHDNEGGGYKAQYDANAYGIGGKLRDLTARTWSYGQTVETASKDMKQRSEDVQEHKKIKPEESGDTSGS